MSEVDVGKRIKARRKELGISAEEIAESIGVAPATVYRYESSAIMNMKTDKLSPIAEILQTTPAFLMGWTDDPAQTAESSSTASGRTRQMRSPRSDADRAFRLMQEAYRDYVSHFGHRGKWAFPLIDAYESSSPDTQRAVCAVLRIPHVMTDAATRQDATGDDLPEGRHMDTKRAVEPYWEKEAEPGLCANFSRSEQRASAGRGILLDDESMITISVRKDALPADYERYPGRYFGIPVGGNSMEPRFHDGDMLIVSKEPVNIGEIGIFTMEGEGYVKQLGYGVLQSLNPEYADLPLTEDIRCNGKVVGVLDPKAIFRG